MSLDGKAAIVVGGARGIGNAVSLKLAREGASISVCDLNYEESKRTVEEIEFIGGEAIPIKVDATVYEQVKKMMQKTLNKFKRINILVYCAGIYPPLRQLTDIPEEEFDVVFDVNFKGFFLCCNAVVPEMIKNREGKIVSISSMSGIMGKRSTYAVLYGSSKAALILFTKAAARELAPYNINVNTVCPTIVWTDMGKSAARYMGNFSVTGGESYFKNYGGLSVREVFNKFVNENIPLKRTPTPDDIANAILFFVSEESKNITGQALAIDGGADA